MNNKILVWDNIDLELILKSSSHQAKFRANDFDLHPLRVQDDAHECPRSPVRAKISEAWFGDGTYLHSLGVEAEDANLPIFPLPRL